MEPRPKTLEVTFQATRPSGSGDRRLRATCRRQFDLPYFLALVVLFLLDFFAPPFAAPLLLAFFAMALTSFLVRQIYGARKITSTNFFSC